MTPYYKHDGITIYCADNREVFPMLGKFDLLLTDPPYGLADKLHGGSWGKKFEGKDKDWDAAPPTDLLLASAISACEHQIIWGGNYVRVRPSRCWLSWFKPDAPPTMGHFELAWTSFDQNTRQISCSIASTNKERIGHPTQKPLRVMLWCLCIAGESVRTILDPWMGSGTTLVAAKLRGLEATGIEISEDYCKLAVERLRQGVLVPA